jgi:hypothetical protein
MLEVEALRAKTEELERRVSEIESQLAKLTVAPEAVPPRSEGMVVSGDAGSPLILDDWDYRFCAGDYGQYYYWIAVKLRNASPKAIKLIDASICFFDLLDQFVYGIKVPPDVAIAPGDTHTRAGDYDVNRFISEQMRMKDMQKADIRAHLDVKNVVFSDNTILNLELKR